MGVDGGLDGGQRTESGGRRHRISTLEVPGSLARAITALPLVVRMWRSIAVLLTLLAQAACCTVLATGTQRVVVESRPSGASVVLDGAVVGTTPCEVEVSRQSRTIELRLAGYRSQLVELSLAHSKWALGNLLTLGVGMVVDDALGSDRVICTEPVIVSLRPGAGSAAWVWTCSCRGRQVRKHPAPQEPEGVLGVAAWVAYLATAAFGR